MAYGSDDEYGKKEYKVPSVHETGKKNLSAMQRRIELEQEVAELQKVLENEERVHEVLEQALLSNDIQTKLTIPSFLPKKAKELLAEVLMVEEEIAHLEGEISKIKHSLSEQHKLKSQMEVQSKSKPFEQKPASLRPLNHLPKIPSAASKANAREERIPLETGSMFFINQAIKGDYKVHDFVSKRRTDSPTRMTGITAEHQNMVGIQESVSKRSGLIKTSFSPRLLPKLPTPETGKLDPETALNNSKRIPSGSSLFDKGQKGHPNKLSENIMKCCICIFLRQLRTTRAIELEKSSNLSRSAHFSLNLRSVQLEANLSSKARHGSLRHSSERDPFGVFDFEDALIRDIGSYKNLVRFTSSSVQLKGNPSFATLMNKLRTLLDSLGEVDLQLLNHQQKLAFWINMYNICIMHGFIEHGLSSNPEKMLTLRNKVFLNIGGHKLNALTIEHNILRQPLNAKRAYSIGAKDGQEVAQREYGLDHSEPNIAFALCNGNKSSPAVRIYTAENVLNDLEKAKLEYLQASIAVTTRKTIMIPELLLWNINDFAEDLDSLMDWICNQLPTSGSLRKSIAECLKAQSNRKISDFVDIIPNDFEFQYLLPM